MNLISNHTKKATACLRIEVTAVVILHMPVNKGVYLAR
jgi:hypothetical protein